MPTGSGDVVVIGSGKMASDCIRILAREGFRVALAITTRRTEDFGSALANVPPGVETVETDALADCEARVSSLAPDYIFSVNNFLIVGAGMIRSAGKGVINFHNAPLPRYAGLNACSWAIINGEKEHGVTWHFLTGRIDAGDVILQERFAIAREETALTLIMKCIAAGTRLFGDLAGALRSGAAAGRPQDLSARTYHRKGDLPNGGVIDFRWDYAVLERFVRGLNFNPLKNQFVHPRAAVEGRECFIDKVEFAGSAAPDGAPGEVVECGSRRIVVRLRDALAAVTEVRDQRAARLSIQDFTREYRVVPGSLFR